MSTNPWLSPHLLLHHWHFLLLQHREIITIITKAVAANFSTSATFINNSCYRSGSMSTTTEQHGMPFFSSARNCAINV